MIDLPDKDRLQLVKETTPGTAVSPPQFIPLADESPYQPGECGVITEEMIREAMDEMYGRHSMADLPGTWAQFDSEEHSSMTWGQMNALGHGASEYTFPQSDGVTYPGRMTWKCFCGDQITCSYHMLNESIRVHCDRPDSEALKYAYTWAGTPVMFYMNATRDDGSTTHVYPQAAPDGLWSYLVPEGIVMLDDMCVRPGDLVSGTLSIS